MEPSWFKKESNFARQLQLILDFCNQLSHRCQHFQQAHQWNTHRNVDGKICRFRFFGAGSPCHHLQRRSSKKMYLKKWISLSPRATLNPTLLFFLKRIPGDELFASGDYLETLDPNYRVSLLRAYTKAVWPTSARELLVVQVIEILKDGSAYLATKSVVDSNYPEKPGTVRAHATLAAWALKPRPEGTEVMFISFFFFLFSFFSFFFFFLFLFFFLFSFFYFFFFLFSFFFFSFFSSLLFVLFNCFISSSFFYLFGKKEEHKQLCPTIKLRTWLERSAKLTHLLFSFLCSPQAMFLSPIPKDGFPLLFFPCYLLRFPCVSQQSEIIVTYMALPCFLWQLLASKRKKPSPTILPTFCWNMIVSHVRGGWRQQKFSYLRSGFPLEWMLT